MTPAATIVERLLARKFPVPDENKTTREGRYVFTKEELIRIVAAVQADAQGGK